MQDKGRAERGREGQDRAGYGMQLNLLLLLIAQARGCLSHHRRCLFREGLKLIVRHFLRNGRFLKRADSSMMCFLRIKEKVVAVLACIAKDIAEAEAKVPTWVGDEWNAVQPINERGCNSR